MRLEDIRAARERLHEIAIKTPLVRLEIEGTPGEIYLKLENLQRGGSFKVRPAGNRILGLSPDERRRGVFTASSGNFGIAVALLAKQLNIPATVVAPDDAPAAKLDVVRQLGATVHAVSHDEWWDVILTHQFAGTESAFVGDDSTESIRGTGTIGLEIIEQLPDVDAVLMAYGGGGLSCGIAAAIRALKPDTRLIACESEAATPFAAAWSAGEPIDVTYQSSFVSGIGSTTVLPRIWPLASELLDGCAVVSLAQTAKAIRHIAQYSHVVAEGAGAVPVAAALAGFGGKGKLVCVVSGGNISNNDLATILNGGIPAY